MGWKDVEKGSAWNFDEKAEFEGTYLGFEENVGANNSMLYNFKSLDDTPCRSGTLAKFRRGTDRNKPGSHRVLDRIDRISEVCSG